MVCIKLGNGFSCMQRLRRVNLHTIRNQWIYCGTVHLQPSRKWYDHDHYGLQTLRIFHTFLACPLSLSPILFHEFEWNLAGVLRHKSIYMYMHEDNSCSTDFAWVLALDTRNMCLITLFLLWNIPTRGHMFHERPLSSKQENWKFDQGCHNNGTFCLWNLYHESGYFCVDLFLQI